MLRIAAALPSDTAQRVTQLLADTLYVNQRGQLAELLAEDQPVTAPSIDDLLLIGQRKAAYYCYAFPFALGAHIAGHDPAIIDAACQLLVRIGTASPGDRRHHWRVPRRPGRRQGHPRRDHPSAPHRAPRPAGQHDPRRDIRELLTTTPPLERDQALRVRDALWNSDIPRLATQTCERLLADIDHQVGNLQLGTATTAYLHDLVDARLRSKIDSMRQVSAHAAEGEPASIPRWAARADTLLAAQHRPCSGAIRLVIMALPTMRPLRVALQLQPQHADYAAIRRAAAEAEELGADVVFNWDHFFPLYGDPDGKHFECWTMLGAWAEHTSRVEIGALVTCNSYRNPELLADMARTIDHISDGRLILGIGSGWFEKDYSEYGYEFGTAGSRIDDLAENLPRIESRLGKLNPPPTRKIPLLIGGGGEKKTLPLVARHADIWHGFGNVDVAERKVRILDQHCADVGRDPAEIERSLGVGGDPEDLGPKLRDLGITMFTIGVGGPDYDLSQLRAWIAWRDKHNG